MNCHHWGLFSLSLWVAVFSQSLKVHVLRLFHRMQRRMLSFPPQLISNVDSDCAPYSQEALDTAPFAPAGTMLTEKTHLPCIVKILLIAIYVTQDGGASAEKKKKTFGPCMNLSLKLSKKFVLMQYK